MRGSIKTASVFLFCLILGLGACNDESGDGGGGGHAYAVAGPSALSRGAQGTYTVSPASGAAGYRWRVEGSGILQTTADQSTITVKATTKTLGGTFTVYLQIQKDGKWQEATPLKVKVYAMPTFKVVLENPYDLTPTTLTGSGTITLTNVAGGGTRWLLYFVGDTSGLPKMVPVTVSTTNDIGAFMNEWLEVSPQTKLLYFPRAGGGSVGNGGTVWDIPAGRPWLLTGSQPAGGTTTLTANGVQTMIITVIRP